MNKSHQCIVYHISISICSLTFDLCFPCVFVNIFIFNKKFFNPEHDNSERNNDKGIITSKGGQRVGLSKGGRRGVDSSKGQGVGLSKGGRGVGSSKGGRAIGLSKGGRGVGLNTKQSNIIVSSVVAPVRCTSSLVLIVGTCLQDLILELKDSVQPWLKMGRMNLVV